MELVQVPAGELVMGSPPTEPGRESQETQHLVPIPRPFFIGRTEVTQAQWQRVMGSNPSWFSECGGDCPVERVSWHDTQAFLERLEQLGSERLRLPTEVEWEYACRAGTVTAFHWGAFLSTGSANFDAGVAEVDAGRAGDGLQDDRVGRQPMPVASFPPNAWGLHDLHGNVWEWTADWHCSYPGGADADPACANDVRVIRGGSWHYAADSARCALRYTHRPQDLGFSLGFRLVREAD